MDTDFIKPQMYSRGAESPSEKKRSDSAQVAENVLRYVLGYKIMRRPPLVLTGAETGRCEFNLKNIRAILAWSL